MGLWLQETIGSIPIGRFPPGESLEEEIEVRGISPEELAGLCGVPVENLKQVFRGSREIMPELAARLEKVLGIKASLLD